MVEIIYNQQYYDQILTERFCGQRPFEQINFSLGSLAQESLKQRWLCHVGCCNFANAITMGKRSIATTGFGLTGIPHIGSIAQMVRSILLQKAGVPVQIVLGDLDAYCGKAVDFNYTQELVARYKNFIKNLGFSDEKESLVRTQSDALSVLKTLYIMGYYMDDQMFNLAKEDIHDYYSRQNKIDNGITYRIKLSLNLMVADFVDLYISRGYDHVLVFLGIDEYKYVSLAMNSLDKARLDGAYGGLELSGIFSKIIRGLNGHPKMGKSLAGSGIYPTMDRDKVRKIILDCGLETCHVDDNLVFQMMSAASFFGLETIDKARETCHLQGSAWLRLIDEYLSELFWIMDKWED